MKAVGLCNVSVPHLEALARTGRELPQAGVDDVPSALKTNLLMWDNGENIERKNIHKRVGWVLM